MSKKQICLAFFVGMVAGLIGGTGASQLLMGVTVLAEKAPDYKKIVQAEEFALVNKDSQVCSKVFMTQENRPALMLYDQATQKGTILELSPAWLSIIHLLV